MRGVLLIAVGHPYYGNYANQLAISIKAVDPDIKICIVHSKDSLSHLSRDFFDHKILCPESYYITKGVPDYLKVKTYIYDLSPFAETIFLDADMIWLPKKKISELFDKFKDVDFTMTSRGREELKTVKGGLIHWANPDDIREKYGTDGWLYNLASEFIYFKRSDEIKGMFDKAKEIYLDPRISFKKFGNGMPDELAFELAMISTRVYPKNDIFIPFYWEQFHRKALPTFKMYEEFYAYSMGGNVNTPGVAHIYNGLADYYNRKMGINGYFPAKNKKSFLSERQWL